MNRSRLYEDKFPVSPYTDAPAQPPKRKGWLKNVFGKVCAIGSLAATIGFYQGAFQLSGDVYDNWQASQNSWNDNSKASDVLKPHEGHTSWPKEGGLLALSLSAGFAGIALGKKRQQRYEGGGSYGYYDRGGNDGFFRGYMFGSMSSRSSSSSNDGKGMLAMLAIGTLAVAAAGTAIVTYKSLRQNFWPAPKK